MNISPIVKMDLALRIISNGGVWLCIALFWDLQTISFEIPWFLGKKKQPWTFLRFVSLTSFLGSQNFSTPKKKPGEPKWQAAVCSGWPKDVLEDSTLHHLNGSGGQGIHTHWVMGSEHPEDGKNEQRCKNHLEKDGFLKKMILSSFFSDGQMISLWLL